MRIFQKPWKKRYITLVAAAFLLVSYGMLLLPFLFAEQLATSRSPDGECSVSVLDGDSRFIPSFLERGQHIFLWKRWHLLPGELGCAYHYGDLDSSPICTISWSGRKVTVFMDGGDEGGTERLVYDTR